MSKLHEKTNHPNLFKETYWGNFPYDPVKYPDHDACIKNRNDFVELFSIKEFNDSLKKIYGRQHLYGIDHQEYYRTTDGKWVYVNSTYTVANPAMDELGLVEIPTLYGARAKTYVIVFNTWQERSKWRADVDKRINRKDLLTSLTRSFELPYSSFEAPDPKGNPLLLPMTVWPQII